jgi:anti-sigma-K factor RskA
MPGRRWPQTLKTTPHPIEPAMNYLEPERLDALAAQYVLGTLSRAARERLARLASGNETVAAALRAWENRLLPLAESLSPVAPPERVWPAILDRIQGQRESGSMWANLGLWRGLTLAGFATAMALAVVLLTPRPETPIETLVVVLAGQDARPALLVSADRSGRTLTVKAIAPVQPVADRVLQLWALPEQGSPRSLGLIPATGAVSSVVRLDLPAPVGLALQNIPALAVSLEPQGGSPTGLPTGPVLYSGPIQRLY